MHELRHPLFLLAITVAAAQTASWWSANLPLQVVAVFVLVVVGISHGAWDLVTLLQARRKVLATSLYLFLAVLAFALWWLAPELLLPVFLTVSVLHFGLSDRRGCGCIGRFEGLLRGLLVVVAPAWTGAEAINVLFQQVMAESAANSLMTTLKLAAPWILGLGGFAALVSIQSDRATALELLALIGMALWVPPLLAFSLYFVFLHAWRSWAATETRVRTALNLRLVGLASVGAIVLAGLATRMLDGNALQLLFAGLFAVTVPHVLLHARLLRLA